jgi:hypothetical protein
LKRKKGDDKEQPIVIETPETARKTSLSKGSKKKGKNPFQGVDAVVNIEETPDSRRGKMKGKNSFSLLKQQQWKNPGNHSPGLQQRN